MCAFHPTSDHAYSRLQSAGWSIGDVSFIRDGRIIWMVYGHRGDHKLKAEGRTQREAWAAAARLADQVDAEPA